MRKALILAIIFSFILPIIITNSPVQAHIVSTALQASSQYETAKSGPISPDVQAALDSLPHGDMLTVIVTLADQTDLSLIPGAGHAAQQQGIIRALQAKAEASQRQIINLLAVRSAQGKVDQVTPFWVFNGLAVTASADVIQELAARAEVRSITPDDIQIITSPLALNPPESNLSVVKAPDLWGLGYSGQGIVVANMDTGVDLSHPDLAATWRGGSNSWYDPFGQHPTTPIDLNGHGTHTMGVLVGGESGGTAIGLAPSAQWMAVKIFNDQGSSTATAIHAGFQWLMDPDQNPASADAPHVVNNSWTMAYPGCDLEFEFDLGSLRAVGILPVFAAGNSGPSPETSYSPANNPSVFAVGSTDNTDQIYGTSSRGPSACEQTTFPDVVAPGVGIHTADLHGVYSDETGTSMAAPHVAGGLALLLSAFPGISVDQQEAALLNSAIDLGPLGPDNDFGYGRLDLLAAYQWLNSAPPPTPTPTSDPNVNLALGKPAEVSSSQDSASSGAMAVDGDLASYWKTARAKGKNKLPADWITIDLGSSQSIGRVVLEWEANYATSYTIQVSQDQATWTTVSSTTTGNGGNDTHSFNPTTARYVKMESTAWSSGSLRNWLREFEVYPGSGSAPTATPTSTPIEPTPTPLPTATPTPQPGGLSLHIGDLDGLAANVNRKNWNATLTVLVHDANENPVAGVTVFGAWSGGISDSGSCVTDVSGSCQITSQNIRTNKSSVTFTVTDVVRSADSYNASANHDPDGDSAGTSIPVLRP